MLSISKISLLSTILTLVACAANSSDPASESEDVVGLTDLTQMEQEFGLVKDQKINGQWTRSDEKLKAGACYNPDLEVRRYTKGAAFFAKKGTAPGTGDKRAVMCVDFDGEERPISLYGFGLDLAVRAHLGAPLRYEGATGHVFLTFERGNMEVGDPGHYCGLRLDPTTRPGPNDPALEAGNDAYAACRQGGGTDETCYSTGMRACENFVRADAAAESLDRPGYDQNYVYEVNRGAPGAPGPTAALLMLVYKYAGKQAVRTDSYSIKDDPIGLVKTWANDHVVFERAEARRVATATEEKLTLSGGGKVLAECTRSVDGSGPKSAFRCSGL